MLLYGIHSGAVDVPPEFHDILVRISPRSDQRLQFIFGQTHLQGTHCFECADRAAVAKGEFSDFAFLPQVSVYAVLFHRNFEHL